MAFCSFERFIELSIPDTAFAGLELITEATAANPDSLTIYVKSTTGSKTLQPGYVELDATEGVVRLYAKGSAGVKTLGF